MLGAFAQFVSAVHSLRSRTVGESRPQETQRTATFWEIPSIHSIHSIHFFMVPWLVPSWEVVTVDHPSCTRSPRPSFMTGGHTPCTAAFFRSWTPTSDPAPDQLPYKHHSWTHNESTSLHIFKILEILFEARKLHSFGSTTKLTHLFNIGDILFRMKSQFGCVGGTTEMGCP